MRKIKIPLPLLLLILALFTAACGSDFIGADLKYVAIGASDATGVGADPIDSGYVYVIEDGLEDQCGTGDEESELQNLGIPGLDADEIADTELPIATKLDPDVVTVFTGGNDIVGGRDPAAFETDLAKILGDLRDHTNAILFVANLPDMTQLPEFQTDPDPDVTPERVAAFNAAIERQAQASGATLVDLFSQPVQANYVAGDGFHPSNEGHRAIAEQFLAQIIPQICPNGQFEG